ncbi:MAG TPA: LuxR C-terminal-related transcriptional regulator, partial [Ilumatobacteraceae bacterium]|nr:LuxR C-terminal-related transcriptional regulator [Ilumatobacteraceae bacterium]
LRQALGVPFRPYFLDVLARQRDALRDALTSPVFARVWSEGTALTLPDALAAVATFLDQAPPTGRLSAREREVLQLVAQGASDGEIAARLYISRHTASKHVASVLAKLDAPNRTAAVAAAYRRGLIAP